MADTKVSALTAASTLDGSELLHIVQGAADRKATTAAIAGLVTDERIDDRVAALLVAGTGITITYNDAANTLTIAATGGGGGGSSTVSPVNDAGTTRTLATADAGTKIRTSASAAVTHTIPTNAADAIPVGSVIGVRQQGTGQVTVTPASGVTLNIPTGLTAKTRVQGSELILHKVGTNEWDITGDLST